MKKNRKLIAASLLIVALIVMGAVSVFSQTDERGKRHRAYAGLSDQLTEEQKELLSQKMQELKDSGATREEMREAIRQLLEEWGIDTENCGMMNPKGR
jgi:hypothetical protein